MKIRLLEGDGGHGLIANAIREALIAVTGDDGNIILADDGKPIALTKFLDAAILDKCVIVLAEERSAASKAAGHFVAGNTVLLIEGYERPVAMKTVRNLMSGEEIEIPADTPLACDPSSETYWSM